MSENRRAALLAISVVMMGLCSGLGIWAAGHPKGVAAGLVLLFLSGAFFGIWVMLVGAHIKAATGEDSSRVGNERKV